MKNNGQKYLKNNGQKYLKNNDKKFLKNNGIKIFKKVIKNYPHFIPLYTNGQNADNIVFSLWENALKIASILHVCSLLRIMRVRDGITNET